MLVIRSHCKHVVSKTFCILSEFLHLLLGVAFSYEKKVNLVGRVSVVDDFGYFKVVYNFLADKLVCRVNTN